MSDEAFHEIQLNGKQLVFLFMAATVVAVVVFLCGVMVGRGVRIERAAAPANEGVAAALDPTAAAQAQPPPSASVPTATGGAPVSAQETLTYTERLEAPTPAAETLRMPVERASVESEAPAAVAEPAVDSPPASSAAAAEPPGRAFVVQVAAVRARDEAEVIARRLTTKGYPAFVTTPTGAVQVFRVRVGKYESRREAESVAGRLEQEEHFKPWITR